VNVVHIAHILCKCAPSCSQEATSYDGAYGRTLTDPEAYWDDLLCRFRAAWNEDPIPVDFKPLPPSCAQGAMTVVEQKRFEMPLHVVKPLCYSA
jgi:hypothetical protein